MASVIRIIKKWLFLGVAVALVPVSLSAQESAELDVVFNANAALLPEGDSVAVKIPPEPSTQILGSSMEPEGPVLDTTEERVYRENLDNEVKKKMARRKSNAKSIRYRPLENDPKVDPLDKNYQEWRKKTEATATTKDAAVDPEYEKFVKDISALIFSINHQKIPSKTEEMLTKIPASSLVPIPRVLEPKNSVSIKRGADVSNYFQGKDEVNEDTTVGLKIAIKDTDMNEMRSLQMAYEALTQGQTEGAIALYKHVLSMSPANKQALFGLGTAYHRSGQIDEAEEMYLALLEKDKNHWEALNNLMILIGDEAPEDAIKELRKLEQGNPEFSPIPAHIGMIYMQTEQYEEAAKYLSRAVILSPENLYYRYNLAVLLDHMGYKAQAVRLYKQVVEEGMKGKETPEPIDNIRNRVSFLVSELNVNSDSTINQ